MVQVKTQMGMRDDMNELERGHSMAITRRRVPVSLSKKPAPETVEANKSSPSTIPRSHDTAVLTCSIRVQVLATFRGGVLPAIGLARPNLP